VRRIDYEYDVLKESKRPQMCDGPDRSDRDEDIPIRAKSVQLEC